MFVLSGINKIAHFKSTVESLKSKASWWPLPQTSILMTIILEIICPIIIIYSMFNSKLRLASTVSIVMLLMFTITVTLIYHPLKFNSSYMKNLPFFSNLSLIGGMTLLLTQEQN